MKKALVFVIVLLLVGATGDNSFEFAQRAFGELKPGKVGCDAPETVKPYSDLVYEAKPKGHKCWINYRKKGELIRQPDGSAISTSSSVTVTAEKYEDMEILKRKWLNPKNINNQKIKAGPVRGRFNGEKTGATSWVSSNYYILIIHSGDATEIEDVYNYYLERYPSTLSITESDIDPRKINKYELQRHMKIIWKAEEYRGLLKSKADKYIGTLAQCQEEATIRAAAGLCKEALIHPDVPPDQQMIYCPIALNFNNTERKEQWKGLEEAALESDKLDFDTDTWQCNYVGTHFITVPVACKLNFTEKDHKEAKEKGDIPEQFPLFGATEELCARDREMKKDLRIYKNGL